MLPIREDIKLVTEEQPTRTYAMKIFGDRINGYTDKIEAMKQAIYKILNTERYQYPIYSWNYGIELKDLIGKPKNYCKVEIERRVTEALLQDERILEVGAFYFEDIKRRGLAVTFTASTVFGDVSLNKEVQV